ncbi:MAG: polysaccharide deacetylase family protein [Desulfobacteraceae bacterium]|nr:polysaccharide deacetylase family protein [Desulfobacteraceae bacterium]
MESPIVFIYHRVGVDHIDSQLLAVSPINFESQLAVLSEICRVVPLHHLIAEARSGELKPNTVALTFDDGYLDNLTNALPILEKFNLHATIFVTSGLIGSPQEFWWDALERIFLTCEPLPEFLRLSNRGREHAWDMCSPEGRVMAYEQLCSHIRTKRASEINEILDSLFRWAGLEQISRTTHRVMNEANLKDLSSYPLIEIGAHGVNHVILNLMRPEDQRYEIRESKKALEGITGKPIRLFSYPYGTAADFNEITKKILAEEGFEGGIANTQGAIEKPLDLYAIPRRLVRNWSGEEFLGWLTGGNLDELEAETVSKRIDSLISYQFKRVYGDTSYA